MQAKPLRIGIAGLGTVGASLFNLISNKNDVLSARCGRPIVVTAVNARDRSKDRGINLDNTQWFDTAESLAVSDAIDVFVELIGGADGPAYMASCAALRHGKHVVTANKAMLAKHGVELAALAEENGLLLNFEAAVAGGIPIIKTMREALTANDINSIYGILNGTCNYMLTRMELEGISYDECLKDAQRLGYAEADPTFDVEGFDTAHKLAILTSLAFGTQIAADDMAVEGISSITTTDIEAAKSFGFRIKLLGKASRLDDGITQSVCPTMVPLESTIAQISGVTNAVGIEADIVGDIMMSGPGAGGNATASAVAGDIADIAKCLPGAQTVPALAVPAKLLKPFKPAAPIIHEGGFFVRLTVKDHAGVFAKISTTMANLNISLESIVQNGMNEGNKTIILITHACMEADIRQALDEISKDDFLADTIQLIRIER